MEFRKYNKIHRLGKEEVDGILDGVCHIQEKIDGANASIWIDEEGMIQCGSRNRHLIDDDFNGFVSFVRNHPGIYEYFSWYPNSILYGEWLVKHTINYREDAYKKFYLFDIYDGFSFLDPAEVIRASDCYKIERIPYIGVLNNPSIDQLKEFVGKSLFGDRGEGVVIKNMNFRNKFGDLCYAKLVSESFKEDNLLAFNDNDKHSEDYNERYFVNKYMTLGRVQKVIDKIQPEINERLDMKHIPRVCNSAYHDMLTEEIWEASKKIQSIKFNSLKNLAMKKAKQIYVDILDDIRDKAA